MNAKCTGDSTPTRAPRSLLASRATQPREGRDGPLQRATDSEHWVAVCSTTRKEEAFLQRAGLADLGDKYLNGHDVAHHLGVDLT